MLPIRTILFADIEGSVQLFRRLGDARALAAVEACHAATRAAIDRRGGVVVKLIGDGLMAAFETAAHACEAAILAQEAVRQAVPAADGPAGEAADAPPLRLRIGIHSGPVIETETDRFGDTVNIASRLSAVANGGEIVISAALGESLTGPLRTMMRRLGSVSLKGVAEGFPVLELLWSYDAAVTVLPHDILKQTVSPETVRMELAHASRRWRSSSMHQRVTIGRGDTSDFIITDPRASRDHATIQRDGEQWVLTDHSTNGTFIVFAGETVLALRRKELVLHGLGDIGFGFDPEKEPADALRFTVFSAR
ncbi:MAG: adenylate/guanylate cyclase domain-containing protein [Beijerinckiaceae bacterium]